MTSQAPRTLSWTATTECKGMKRLVKQREQVLEWQRAHKNPKFQSAHQQAFDENFGQSKSYRDALALIQSFCHVADVKQWPITSHLIALVIFERNSCRYTAPPKIISHLRKISQKLSEALEPKGFIPEPLPCGLMTEEEVDEALDAFAAERATGLATKGLETALVRAKQERSARGLRPLGRQEDREESVEITVAASPRAIRRRRAWNVLPSPSASPVASPPEKKLRSAQPDETPPKSLDAPSSSQTEHVKNTPSPKTPRKRPNPSSSSIAKNTKPPQLEPSAKTPPRPRTRSPSLYGDDRQLPVIPTSKDLPTTTPSKDESVPAPLVSDETESEEFLVPTRQDEPVSVLQLALFLRALDASLDSLATPLHTAGFDTVEKLVALAFFEDRTIARIFGALKATKEGAGIEASQVRLLKEKLKEARSGDF
ncbi:uncharacterized protein JCM6883_002077 [Sporobolomyces salmoneus]|uniref:uncharacterized protein n=1 Tax=Sporobolomyces salmoneus TaxID=183962 RepID=UPI003176A7FB